VCRSALPIGFRFCFQLLLKPKFSGIEKIKTIGSTYMLASGLRPGKEDAMGVSFILLFISKLTIIDIIMKPTYRMFINSQKMH
jgi:adenylate cyclase 2